MDTDRDRQIAERFFVDTDQDSHWFLVPVNKRDEWNAWCDIDPDDERAWTPPSWAKPLGGGPQQVEFVLPDAIAHALAEARAETKKELLSRSPSLDCASATGSPRKPLHERLRAMESCGRSISELPCVRPNGHSGNCSGYVCDEDVANDCEVVLEDSHVVRRADRPGG